MTDLTTVYKEDPELYKSLSTARLAQHAGDVISNVFGNAKLTKFDMYQELHSAIPYLKHIVHNHVKMTWQFIFEDKVNLDIHIGRKSDERNEESPS